MRYAETAEERGRSGKKRKEEETRWLSGTHPPLPGFPQVMLPYTDAKERQGVSHREDSHEARG